MLTLTNSAVRASKSRSTFTPVPVVPIDAGATVVAAGGQSDHYRWKKKKKRSHEGKASSPTEKHSSESKP